jgi:hypothetical protein
MEASTDVVIIDGTGGYGRQMLDNAHQPSRGPTSSPPVRCGPAALVAVGRVRPPRQSLAGWCGMNPGGTPERRAARGRDVGARAPEVAC